jgi:hypothetical protein
MDKIMNEEELFKAMDFLGIKRPKKKPPIHIHHFQITDGKDVIVRDGIIFDTVEEAIKCKIKR